MADLHTIAQVAYDQVFPNADDQTSIKVQHFIEVAKTRYAQELFILSKESKRIDGKWDIPESLLRETTLKIENNEADISDLKIFQSFEGHKWVGMLGRFGNDDCKYIKQTINLANIIDSEEYCGNSKPYVIIGKKIKFPLGAHHDTESLIYASSGEDLDDSFEVDDAIGDRVGDYLFKRFSNKLPEDRTDNSNSNK